MIQGTLLLTVICATAGFNILTVPVKHFERKDDHLFGQTIIESEEGILVTSPSSATQKLFHCTLKNGCAEVNVAGNVRKGFRPIVSAAKKAGQDQHMVCQQVRKLKAINEDLNGYCACLENLQKKEELSLASLIVEQMNRTSISSSNNNNNNNNSPEDGSDLDPLALHKKRQTSDDNSNNNNNNEDEDDEDPGTEIAIVLDGSGSIEPPDFERAKEFISNVMKKVWETCFTCNFGIVQYGKIIRTELLLNENENATKALEKVKGIQQIGSHTITASAINHVLEHVFVAENGSKENAKKMIIVMTDGSIFLDPMNLTDVLNSPKIKNVVRFAIGVGEALNDSKAKAELEEIASVPTEKHKFMVTNYDALDEILSNLELSLMTGIEGIQQGAGFRFELAEAGFSSYFAQDGNLIFGAVGAYDWSGGIIMKNPMHKRLTFLNDSSTRSRFSYLGYSLGSAQGSTESLYVSGAPRYNLTGSVHVFNNKSQKLAQILLGDQMGSYFGAELCVLDFNRDGKTDYLLVGAPYFHIKGEEGKVYVYRLNQMQGLFEKEGIEWQGADGHIFAMFGSAIASIGDIDRNRFDDVAVGAPLEEDNASGSSGSIYIYNGYEGGIQPQFSQRISAAEMGTKLRFFGRSVSGMPETKQSRRREYMSVGTEGGVIVLQALPVIVFKPQITINPEILPLPDSDGDTFEDKQVTLKICLNTVRGRITEGQLPVEYEVNVDAAQQKKRLSFVDSVNSASQSGFLNLTADRECLDIINLKFTKLQKCEPYLRLAFPAIELLSGRELPDSRKKGWNQFMSHSTYGTIAVGIPYIQHKTYHGCDDCFAPISIKLSIALPNNSLTGPPLRILDKFSPTEFTTQLPFQRECKTCMAEISLSGSKLSTNMIVVGRIQNLSIAFNLINRGDVAYMTTLVLTYPNFLDFNNKVTGLKPSDSVIVCKSERGDTSSQLKCNIMHPELKKSAEVSFSIPGVVVPDKTQIRSVPKIITNLTCENDGTQVLDKKTFDLTVKKNLQVQLIGRTRPQFLNFNINEEKKPKNLMFEFELYGENKYDATIYVNINITLQAKHAELHISKIEKGNCSFTKDFVITEYKSCLIRCAVTKLKHQIVIKAEALIENSVDKSEVVVANATLEFNRDEYDTAEKDDLSKLVKVSIVSAEIFKSTGVIVGASIGGFLLLAIIIVILIKCGFFRSRYSVEQAEDTD